ncbi:MAG: sensor histidine kinase [Microbacteriaceae bacterium]|nr:sensor histidine kinase [Microbacteriaceae bacterium]
MNDPRWRTVMTVTPYLVLAMLVAFGLGIGWGQWARLVPVLVLCGVYALWVLVFRDLPLPWRGRPATVAVLLVGLIAINLLLVWREGWFGFLCIATFTIAYSLAEWPWELPAVGVTAVVAGLAQSSSFGLDPVGITERAIVVALNVVVMCGLSWGLQLAERQLHRAATEAERARLAREIHDTLAQGFAGIVTQLQASDTSADDRHVRAALDLARDGLAEARRSVQALRPVALDAAGLPEAITTAARRWSQRTGVPVDVRIDPLPPLPMDAEVALLRTAQEALANVERHARARSVTVTLRRDGRGARLEVRDDGRGFDPATPPGDSADGGYGLIAMRERIEALSGDLVVETGPGRGTLVRAEVPA